MYTNVDSDIHAEAIWSRLTQVSKYSIKKKKKKLFIVVNILPAKSPGKAVQTLIRLLLKDQSDQGLHCLLF